MASQGGKLFSGDVRPHLTASDLALQSLRDAILHGNVRGGTRLLQHEVAKELGLSTTPVREALRTLASEGLVDFDANRGAVVREVRKEEMEEIVWLRRILEPECIRLATERASADVLDQADELATAMTGERDLGRWTSMNRTFHSLLFEGSQSPWLISLLTTLRSASAIYLAASLRNAPEPMAPGNREHRELVKAMRNRDVEAAAEVATRHVTSLFEVAMGEGDDDDEASAAE